MINQDLIKELFNYRNGELVWKISVRGHGGNRLGKAAGTISRCGKNYLRIKIGIRGRTYMAHHLIFLYHYGYIPSQIDHIDRNSLNNRIENLRVADDSQQEGNKPVRSDNKSGFRGVFWNKQKNKWQAKIKNQHIGFFSDIKIGAKAYNKVAKEVFGEFAYLNEVEL